MKLQKKITALIAICIAAIAVCLAMCVGFGGSSNTGRAVVSRALKQAANTQSVALAANEKETTGTTEETTAASEETAEETNADETAESLTEAETEETAAETEAETAEAETQPSVSFEDADAIMYSAGEVNVRTGPSSAYDVMYVLSTNESVYVTGYGDNGWYRVSISGTVGYACSDYLLWEKVEEETTAAPDNDYYEEPEEETTAAPSYDEPETYDSSDDSDSSYDSSLGAQIAADAWNYVGVLPYVWGNHSLDPAIGADCSGFLHALYAQYGIYVSSSSDAIASQGYSVSVSEAKPGDIVVYYNGGHVGIYIGDGMMIHAPGPGQYVSTISIYYTTISDIRRVID